VSCPLIANASVMRITRVDECGAPVEGPNNAFVAECFSSIAMANVTDEQDDIIYRAANGKVCGYRKGCVSFLGFDVTLSVYSVSPELLEIITGNPVVMPATGTAPIGIDTCSVQCNTGFALELWVEVLGEACTGEDPQFLYILIPWITNGIIGDLEIGSESVTLELTGSTRANGAWGVGPYNVQEGVGGACGPMLTPLGDTCHRRIFTSACPPPVASCDYVAVPVTP
jgi:hypothetical protein